MVDADRLLATVQGQGADVAALLRDGGSVAQSLADREQALQLLARSGDRAFNAVGDQGTALAAAFRQLPGFQREATRTLNELTRFANQRTADVAAVRRELAPLSPAVQALAADAPALRTVVESTPRLARAAKSGLPALDRVLGDAPPLFEQLDPFLRSLNPALRYLASTRTELTGLIANLAAATQSATATPKSKEPVHYLRAMPVLNPAALGPLSQRPGANRANPYPNGTTLDLLNGYTSWTSSNCGRPTPYITDDPSPYLTEEQRTEIHDYAFGGKPDDPPAPACKAQAAGAAAGGSGIPGLFPLLPADR
jgi:ABC-type transporter Mla subunit MlaD